MSAPASPSTTKRRPRKGDDARSTFTFRLPQVMREHLAVSAETKGRSFSEEIEWRLAESMEIDQIFGGTATAQIGRLVAAGIHVAQEGKHWRDDEETRLRCRAVAIKIINSLMGDAPNRLTAAANDPALARKIRRAEEDAVEIAADTIHAEMKLMAKRPPAVQPPSREHVQKQIADLPFE